MTNLLRTGLLAAAPTALVTAAGFLIGGHAGMWIALLFAAALQRVGTSAFAVGHPVFSNHPPTEERIARLRKMAQGTAQRGVRA